MPITYIWISMPCFIQQRILSFLYFDIWVSLDSMYTFGIFLHANDEIWKLGTCHIVSLKCNSETDVACTPVGFSVPASPASAGLAARRCSLPTTIYLQSPPPTDTGGRHGDHGDAPTSNERGSSPIMKTHNCKIDNRSNINKLYGWRWRQPKTSYSS